MTKEFDFKEICKDFIMMLKIKVSRRKTAKLTAKIEKELCMEDGEIPLSTVQIKKKASRTMWTNPKLIKDIIEGIIVLGLFAGAFTIIIGFLGFCLVIFAGMMRDMFIFFWNMSDYFKPPLAIAAIGVSLLVVACVAMIVFEICKKISNVNISKWWTSVISEADMEKYKEEYKTQNNKVELTGEHSEAIDINEVYQGWKTALSAQAMAHDECDEYDDDYHEWLNRVHGGKVPWAK